jgi:hypothetical protein
LLGTIVNFDSGPLAKIFVVSALVAEVAAEGTTDGIDRLSRATMTTGSGDFRPTNGCFLRENDSSGRFGSCQA